jgi:hypothetical protein
MNSPQTHPRRSIGQWIVTVIFCLLGAAFFFRFVQFGLKWVRHVVEGDANFKALTLWSLLYVVVCAGIAVTAYCLSSSSDDEPVENGNVETK